MPCVTALMDENIYNKSSNLYNTTYPILNDENMNVYQVNNNNAIKKVDLKIERIPSSSSSTTTTNTENKDEPDENTPIIPPPSPTTVSSNGISSPPPKTSMEVFMKYIKYRPDGTTDSSGILQKACYQEWLQSRKNKLKNAPLTFVHTIRSHVTSCPKTGRNPFPAEVEKDLLSHFRRKHVWPCFHGTTVKYGSRGMLVRGYHETRAKESLEALKSIAKTSTTNTSSSLKSEYPEPLNASWVPVYNQTIQPPVHHYHNRQDSDDALEILNLFGMVNSTPTTITTTTTTTSSSTISTKRTLDSLRYFDDLSTNIVVKKQRR